MHTRRWRESVLSVVPAEAGTQRCGVVVASVTNSIPYSTGRGQPGEIRPSADISVQSSVGMGCCIILMLSVISSIEPGPGTTETTDGWADTNCRAAALMGTPYRSQIAS